MVLTTLIGVAIGFPTFAAGINGDLVLEAQQTSKFKPVSDRGSVGKASVTVDDLVRRTQIPRAALSQDGKLAAYLVVQGDPKVDAYKITIRVVDTSHVSDPITLAEYWLSPEVAFNDDGWLLPSAGDVSWLASDKLLFTAGVGKATQLFMWNARSRKAHVVMKAHERIEFTTADPARQTVSLISSDPIAPKNTLSDSPEDYSVRVRDGYQFYSALQNPKTGRRLRRQRWSYAATKNPGLQSDGQSFDEWENQPAEAPVGAPSVGTTDTEEYLTEQVPSPDGLKVAGLQIRFSNLRVPAKSYSSFRVIVNEAGQSKILAPDCRPFVLSSTTLLGWSAGGRLINYLYVGPKFTSIRNVSLTGMVHDVATIPALLAKPCTYWHLCQILSNDGHFALLTRSSNTMPGELVKVDLQSGAISTLDAPNDKFLRMTQPEVRFYDIEGTDGDAWGRLYLPAGYRPGAHYPLVITQYASSPGFGASVGDEIPILPLTANGIAVFDMYSAGLGGVSSEATGNFGVELSLVQRPLNGMKWIVDRLDADGLVDKERVGIAGVSYGTEIVLYAYWNWNGVRAVSAATGSWSPTTYLLSGVVESQSLTRRGFPDPSDVSAWRELEAGMNARASLPPLLFQSPDAEGVWTAPAWTELRRSGAPVEWFEYPKEGHVKRRPADKWWVFQRNLDWFRFWLKDEEGNDEATRDQFARWRALRGAQKSGEE